MAAERRCSPVGKEFEPEDKDLDRVIKDNLNKYHKIIIRDVTYERLLMHYPYFSREQRRELNQMGNNGTNSNEKIVSRGLEMIEEMEEPLKYKVLKEALQDAGNKKMAGILTGEIVPDVHTIHRERILKQHFSFICEKVNPSEIIATLLACNVIDETDVQRVDQKTKNEGSIAGMRELLIVLPNSHEQWYRIFIETVLDCNPGVAKRIDKELCEKITETRTQGNSLSVLDELTSCVPVTSKVLQDRQRNQQTTTFGQDATDTIEHVMQDFHEASIEVNNLSPPDKHLQSVSVTGSIEFQEVLDDNENVQQDSVNQSVSMRKGYSETQRTSLPSFDGNQNLMESLNFNSLLTDNTGHQSKSINYQEQNPARSVNQPTESIPEVSCSRELSDGGASLRTDFSESYRPNTIGTEQSDETSLKTRVVSSEERSVRTRGDFGEETSVRTVSIESNARVPDEAGVMGATRQDQRRSTELYSRLLRENSHSTVLKVMRDKNMDDLNENHTGNMNINNQEPEPDPISTGEEEVVEDTDITLRGYQQELAKPAIDGKNVIIVAPTGSGKTRVALRIIQEHIRKQQGRGIAKVVFLVNQVALANQQAEECLKQLKCYKSKVISGETQRGRKEYLKDFVDKRDILIVTAQVLLDSLVRKEIDGINMFSLLVFDECHHTHANHTFNQIMGMYMSLKFSKNPPDLPQIVGLTASVGVGKARNEEKAMEHIKKLMANLDTAMICTVQKNMQELRSFVAMPDEETFTVTKRENDIFGESVKKLMNTIEQLMSSSSVVKEMEEAKLFEKVMKAPAGKGTAQYEQWVSRLWKETAKLRSQEARRFLNPCRIHLVHYNMALIIHNDARVQDALSYLDRELKIWRDQAKFMDKNEKKLDAAFQKLRAFPFDRCSDNPKLQKLREIIIKAYRRDPENSRGIVFVRTRELAKAIISWMKETDGLRQLNPIQFLGQTPHADKGGMTKAEQDDVLKYFKDGKHKLIVATSVAEEGLDISKCNLVIRYDYVTNEIAMVQSRGRGRAKDSKYFVLAEEGSGMAEKEELNIIREIMMRKAIIRLQTEIQDQPAKFKKDLHDLQDEADLDQQLKSLGNKRRLPVVGDFEMQCQKCGEFICMSNDLKKIKEAHHVIVDMSLEERVDFVKSETEECSVEVNQPIGKLSCKGCGENLGVIAIYKSIEFAVPKIEKFLIVDRNGRQITKKRWKDVPLFISELEKADFRNILKMRRQNGALNDD